MRLILTIILTCSIVCAEAANSVDKGSKDLLHNPTLTQTFTVFDQLLLGLDHKADQISNHLQPEKNDFRLTSSEFPTLSTVYYDKTLFRTIVEFDLTVNGMDDPWRDVCAKHAKEIAGFRYLDLPNSKTWNPFDQRLISSILGPGIVSDNAQLDRFRAFFDSIVIHLTFKIVDKDNPGHLKFARDCYLDNKTGRITYHQYKY